MKTKFLKRLGQDLWRWTRLVYGRYPKSFVFSVLAIEMWLYILRDGSESAIDIAKVLLPAVIIGSFAAPFINRLRQERAVKWVIDGLSECESSFGLAWERNCINRATFTSFIKNENFDLYKKHPEIAAVALSDFVPVNELVDSNKAKNIFTVLWLNETDRSLELWEKVVSSIANVRATESYIVKLIHHLLTDDEKIDKGIILDRIKDLNDRYIKVSDDFKNFVNLVHELLPLALRDLGKLTDSLELIEGDISEVVEKSLSKCGIDAETNH